MTYADILKALKTLSASELKDLVRAIKALQSVSSSSCESVMDEPDDAIYFLDAIVAFVQRHNLEYMSVTRLRSSTIYRSFTEAVPEVAKYLRQISRDRGALQRNVNMGIRLLYENMRMGTIPISARTIMANIDRIPSLINQQFPAYAENGLLSWIERAKHHNP